jgi:HK97 family phage major capsid protein
LQCAGVRDADDRFVFRNSLAIPPAILKIFTEEIMSRLITLRQSQVELKRQAHDLLDKAEAEGRGLTPEEENTYQDLIAKMSRNSVEISAAVAELERERGISPADGPDSAALITAEIGAGATSSRFKIGKSVSPRRYREMFPGALSARGFTSLNEFLRTVHGGLNDPRLQATATGMGGASPTDGGFFIPTEFAAEMLDVSLESEIVRPRAHIVPMTTQTRKIAGFDDLDNSAGAPFGGLSIQWSNEGDAGTNKKTKSRLIELNAQKAMIFAMVTNELIADGMQFDELLGSAIIKSIGWGLDYAFLNGDGAGKPKGVLTDPALIVVNKESSQPASTIVYENVTNMFSRLHPSCVDNSVWVANSTAIPQLLRMQLVVKNVAGSENVGGSAVPVVAQADGKFTMLTRPVIFTEKIPALGTQGDLILADFSQYAVGMRKEVTLERSIYAGWQTDESGYRAILRADGQGRWSKPFTPKNGNTLSWAVTLQTRS